MNHSLRHFLQKKTLVLAETATIEDAARAMKRRRVGSVVVANGKGRIVGLATDRDLVCGALASGLSVKSPLSEVMSTDIVSVDDEANVFTVIEAMETHGVRRVPVLSKDRGKCVGIITLDDLIMAQMLMPERLVRIIQAQVVKRGHGPKDATRSQASMEHTLNCFYNTVAESTRLPRDTAESVSFHALRNIVQCVCRPAATRFIAQLPHLLHEDLLRLPPGPNARIDGDFMLAELSSHAGLEGMEAVNALRGFWDAVEYKLSPGMASRVHGQMPSDIQVLFREECGLN